MRYQLQNIYEDIWLDRVKVVLPNYRMINNKCGKRKVKVY
jgi:hypothetical protein